MRSSLPPAKRHSAPWPIDTALLEILTLITKEALMGGISRDTALAILPFWLPARFRRRAAQVARTSNPVRGVFPTIRDEASARFGGVTHRSREGDPEPALPELPSL